MNHILKLSAVISLFCMLPGISVQASQAPPGIDRSAFYAAISSSNINEINAALADLKESSSPDKEAYEGVLLMKKSGLLSKPKDKLNTFKSGRQKLEAAIQGDGDNIEYRFLRLIIQENAPKIVKYRSDIQNDSKLIRTSFKKLPPVVQQAVRDYSRKSKSLNNADL